MDPVSQKMIRELIDQVKKEMQTPHQIKGHGNESISEDYLAGRESMGITVIRKLEEVLK